jgi:hypothetical protein
MGPITDHVTRAEAGAILNDVESLRSFNGAGISTTFGVNRGSRLSSLPQCQLYILHIHTRLAYICIKSPSSFCLEALPFCFPMSKAK